MLLRALACAAAVAALFMTTPAASRAQDDDPVAPREFRAAWVATVNNIDWPSRRGLPTEEQKRELLVILDKLVELNMNALVLQIRPSCDALYQSDLEPWSMYITGEGGKAPDPFYDPLEFAVEESHKRGLEIHVWFNPYRAGFLATSSSLSADHISTQRPDLVREYGRHLWLDPSEPDVKDHSINVMLDVVRRYNIDGIHMDDYFYPYKERGEDGKMIDFPDQKNYELYQERGGEKSRSDWRREQVDVFVERLYTALRKQSKHVRMGLSPFGIWRPGYPDQIRGLDQYEELYADAKLWLNEGWIDYWTPQLYWEIAKPEQSFPVLLKWWADENTHNRHYWPGLFLTKGTFSKEEIPYQIQWIRLEPRASGHVHFSMKGFLNNVDGINDRLTTPGGLYARPALVPATPWLGEEKPEPPKADILGRSGVEVTLALAPGGGEHAPRNYAIFTRTGGSGAWRFHVVPASEKEATLTVGAEDLPLEVQVAAVGRLGDESDRTRLSADPSTTGQ